MLEGVCRVHSDRCVDQKAFDGFGKPPVAFLLVLSAATIVLTVPQGVRCSFSSGVLYNVFGASRCMLWVFTAVCALASPLRLGFRTHRTAFHLWAGQMHAIRGPALQEN